MKRRPWAPERESAAAGHAGKTRGMRDGAGHDGKVQGMTGRCGAYWESYGASWEVAVLTLREEEWNAGPWDLYGTEMALEQHVKKKKQHLSQK